MFHITCLYPTIVYSACFKSNHENILSLFSTDGTGREIFRLCLSAKRVYILLICLRFDNGDDRNERLQTDPACAISEILNIFNSNSQKNYSLGANVTVDEMLVGFRGRCKHKMYMPKKPNKYGLKMQCVTDARTNYIYNTYLYTGKNSSFG